MLLKALYDHANAKRLLDDKAFETRIVHALIPLDAQGRLRLDYAVPINQTDAKGKEKPGRSFQLPRSSVGLNNGGAYFLTGNSTAVLGQHKETGEPVATIAKPKDRDAKSFQSFWDQINAAFDSTGDERLAAVIAFRRQYLIEINGRIECSLPFIGWRENNKGKKEFCFFLNPKESLPTAKTIIGFSVAGENLLFQEDEDPLRRYWASAFANAADADEETSPVPSLCLITGNIGVPIAKSHSTLIRGVPGVGAGGYIVSFAKQSPAFSSYGREMGENSPVSVSAATAYALGLNQLLEDPDHHRIIGETCFCFWAKRQQQTAVFFNTLLNQPHPDQVAKFLASPFSGLTDLDLKRERFYSAVFSGAKARIVIRHWLDQPLQQAIINFGRWWNDLQICSVSQEQSPYSLKQLALCILRVTKKQKEKDLLAGRIVALYRAAMEATAPPIHFLKTILDEFHTALLKDEPKKRTYPLSQSRFALIKLILIRNHREGDFMPEIQLADTNDPAYNLGRLLAILEEVQHRYHEYKLKGAGVVERYYGTASSAPASAFPLLLRMARHHLGKLRKGSEKEQKAAFWFEKTMAEIFSKFQPAGPGEPPAFPRILTLQDQGRFALGFYQQKAFRLSTQPKEAPTASPDEEGAQDSEIDE